MTTAQELAPYGQSEAATISGYANEYAKRAAEYRKQLADSLAKTASANFQAQNPYILEDLNSRGLASSSTAVADAQARYLAQLERENQGTLTNFDTATFNDLESVRNQAAMTPIEFERMAIERDYALSDQARQEALANSLARRSSRDSLTSGLLGMGGNLLSGVIAKGGLGSLFGGGGAGAAGAAGTAGAGGAGIGLAPVLGAGAALAGSAYLGQKFGNSIFKSSNAEKRARAGATIGTMLGGPAGTIAGTVIGGITKSAPVKAVSKAFKKAFCFVPGTMIDMPDGSKKPVEMVELGDTITGGMVCSVRASLVPEGDIYNYKGIFVTGTHAVKEEDGVWRRVENTTTGTKTEKSGVVYSLVTDSHRMFINDIEFADEFEHDEYESITMDQSLELLNKEAVNA